MVFMASGFMWFVWALIVTMGNILLSVVVFYFLHSQKKLNRHLSALKYVSLYYAIGMAISVFFALALMAS